MTDEGVTVQLSLADRTVLVTGGGSGIGKGVAAAVVAAGGNAMLVGRNADRLAAAADEIKAAGGAGSVLYEPADVTNEDEVARVVDAATAWAGRLHGVVHCAGGSETIGPITQIDSDAWRRTVDLNVNGTMYVLKHAAREMVRGGGGSFIGISSIAASNTHRWFGAYGVSKSAIDHLMQLAADELGASWVRVNCIRPGLIRTELVAPVLESPELSADYAECTPLPRPGEVEDIANAAVFLLSDASSYITGQVINVDGGLLVRRGPDYSYIVFVSNWFFCCEALPELPSLQGWVEAMTSLGRLIFFDQPGAGVWGSSHGGRAADVGAVVRQHHRGAGRSREQ